MTFTTINDVLAYVESTVLGYDHADAVTDEQVRSLFHEAGIEYGDWLEADDARLGSFADAIQQAAFVHA